MSSSEASHNGEGGDVAELWYLARRAVHRLERTLDRELRVATGQPLSTYALLCALDEPLCANQQGIAEVLGLTKGSVSRQLDAAARAGLVTVTVSPTSRRDNVVTLTPAGADVVGRGREVVGQYALPAGREELAAALAVLAAVPE